jgi:hypothetical protein
MTVVMTDIGKCTVIVLIVFFRLILVAIRWIAGVVYAMCRRALVLLGAWRGLTYARGYETLAC